jgi:RNA polymerase sigma-70 factor (ECF subfamily)
MTDTPRSLLERLRARPDDASWKRFLDLYTPLLERWLRQSGVDDADAADLLQEVFATLVRELPSFEHNARTGAFRCWLRTILVNRVRCFWTDRRAAPVTADSRDILRDLDRLEDPTSDLSKLWDRQHDTFLARRVLELIEKDFTASTWHAFRRLVLEGAKPAAVAAEMGVTVNAVLLAKSRVLRRARQEIAGLTE